MGAYLTDIMSKYKNGFRLTLQIGIKYTDLLNDDSDNENEENNPTGYMVRSNKIQLAGTKGEQSPSSTCDKYATPNPNVKDKFSNNSAFTNKISKLKMEKRFMEVENAGTEILYRCIKCRECADCKINEQIEHISIQDEIEQNIINKSIKVDLVKGITTAKLPFMMDPVSKLLPNKSIKKL